MIDTLRPIQPETPRVAAASDSGASDADGITQVITPTLTGRAEPLTTVDVLVNGVSVGTTPVDATGSWSLMIPAIASLAQGSHAVTVIARDDAGNASLASADLTITVITDAPAAPSAPVLAPASNSGGVIEAVVTNVTTPTVSGTGSPGTTVELLSGGAVIGTTVVGTDGSWSLTVLSAGALSDGFRVLTAVARDRAGNVSSPSPALSIQIDTQPPAAPAGTALAAESRTGPTALSTATNQSSPVLGGTAEPGATVAVSLNGSLIGSVVADGTGAWTLALGSALGNGQYEVTAIATDLAGNVSPASPADADHGRHARPRRAACVRSGAPLRSGEAVTITATYSEPLAIAPTLTVTAAGVVETLPLSGGPFVWTGLYTAPAGVDGVATVAISGAFDDAGNAAATPGGSIQIDNTAPLVAGAPVLAAGADGGALLNDGITAHTTPTIAGESDPFATITLLVDGVAVATTGADAVGAWSITLTFPLTDGTHTLAVRATDAAGNTSGDSPTLRILVDTTPPSAPSILVLRSADGTPIALGGATNDANPVVQGNAEPGVTVELFAGGISLGSSLADAGGTWIIAVAAGATLADGVHELTAIQSDLAGNRSAASPLVSVTVDAAPPSAPSIDSVALEPGGAPVAVLAIPQNLPALSGTAEAGTTVRVLDGTVELGSVVAGADGRWALQPASPLGDGTHSLTAVAVDGAGNVSEPSQALVIVIDTAAPLAPPQPRLASTAGSLISDSDAVTGLIRPTLAGTAEPFAAVEVLAQEVVIGSALADASGSWTYVVGTPLADGGHRISVRAVDAAGNVSPRSPHLDIFVDTFSPEFTSEVGATARIVQLTFGEGVYSASGGPLQASDFVVSADVTILSVAHEAGRGTVLITLSADVEAGLTTIAPAVGRLIDRAGNVVPAVATVITPNTPPIVTVIEADGARVTIRFDEMLDPGSVAAPGDFIVLHSGVVVAVVAVSIDFPGRAVVLELAAVVRVGATVAVSYTPGADALRDLAGEPAAAMSGARRSTSLRRPPSSRAIRRRLHARSPWRASALRRRRERPSPAPRRHAPPRAWSAWLRPRARPTGQREWSSPSWTPSATSVAQPRSGYRFASPG